MSKTEEGSTNSRRNFLKFAAVSAPAVAVAAATGTAAQAAPVTELDEVGGGVRETQHTKAYFETAKF